MRRVEQASGSARLVVDVEAGCRLASLVVFGRELLVTRGPSPLAWGSFPMAPWAGRVRHGRFSFAGASYALPPNLGAHAIHGTVFDRAWERDGDLWFETELAAPWPFPGRVRQRVEIGEDGLSLALEVHAGDVPMPVSCGWHPWFRRRLGAGDPCRLTLDAAFMEARDDEGIPTGRRVPPPPGPWDDCFGGLRRPPEVVWPDALALEIVASCDYLVVYDMEPHAVCVEPQTAPPDALNRDPYVVEPSRPLVATSRWSWRRP